MAAFGTVFQAVLPLMLACTTANRELGFAPGIARPQIPPMGWRSWNWFACDIDQTIMEKMVTAMTTAPPWATKSLHDLGYNHIGLDDCWQSCTGPHGSFHNNTTGSPIVNTTKFPSLASMVSKASAAGLTSGFYGNNCRCHAGEIAEGVAHYAQDAALTLDAGFSGIKIDSCGNQRDMEKYAALWAAGNRSMLVESCGNGPAGSNPKTDLPPQPAYVRMLRGSCPWSFFRVSVDLAPQFYSTVYNINRAVPFLGSGDGDDGPISRPGCWAYPDMMVVGIVTPRPSGQSPYDPRPMRVVEWQTHFAMWAVTSSPLILGFDLTNTTILREAWPIISNEEVIAVSQTWVGHPGRLVYNATEYREVGVAHGSPATHGTTERLPSWQAFAKPLRGGSVALLVVRVWASGGNATLSFPLAELFKGALGASANRPRNIGSIPSAVLVRDIVAHTDNGTAISTVSIDLHAIEPRGSVFIVLTPAQIANE